MSKSGWNTSPAGRTGGQPISSSRSSTLYSLRGDPRRELLERPQLAVGLDELDQVPAGSDRDVAQRNLGHHPVGQ